jgi:hypothetical protein
MRAIYFILKIFGINKLFSFLFTPDANGVYIYVDVNAYPKIGIKSFLYELRDSLRKEFNTTSHNNMIYISFIVDEYGKIHNLNVKKRLQAIDLQKENKVIDIFLSISEWLPAIHRNSFVKQSLIFPVTY